ncbi:transcriptional repressor [Dehalococcoidia bacterium]|nr:transcriptional repressor [Dehalococcoidia bacterium]
MLQSISQNEAQILTAFEDSGCRMTEPRREMAAILSQQAGTFSAEEISAKIPRLGRATVYRTLKLLINAGVICKARLPDGSPRYSLDYGHHHHHLVCETCGCVEEFRNPAVERTLRSISKDMGGELLGHRLEIFRRCPTCVDAGKQSRDYSSPHSH